MSSSSKDQRYGLITAKEASKVPKKQVPLSSNVFGDDSDSAPEDAGGDWIKKAFQKEAEKNSIKKSTKALLKKAEEEDPSVFQYDELYDDMELKKTEIKAAQKEKKESRYVESLLQTAERRKRDQERRIERQVQKERELEGEKFADKESFVTGAYRKKLEEFKKQEEEDARMERLESIADASKQSDLTGFYRHIYRQKMGESLPGADIGTPNEVKESKVPAEKEGSEEKVSSSSTKKEEKDKKKRQYRRRQSASSSDSEEEANPDADSDFSVDSSGSSSESGSGQSSGSEEGEIKKNRKKRSSDQSSGSQKKKAKTSRANGSSDVKATAIQMADEEEQTAKVDEIKNKLEEEKLEKEKEKEEEKRLAEEAKKEQEKIEAKRRIWEKRTVGKVFEEAVKRYQERKTAREA